MPPVVSLGFLQHALEIGRGDDRDLLHGFQVQKVAVGQCGLFVCHQFPFQRRSQERPTAVDATERVPPEEKNKQRLMIQKGGPGSGMAAVAEQFLR